MTKKKIDPETLSVKALLTDTLRAWLEDLAYLRRQRARGRFHGGHRQECGCGANYALHDRHCPQCGLDPSFARSLYPSSFRGRAK